MKSSYLQTALMCAVSSVVSEQVAAQSAILSGDGLRWLAGDLAFEGQVIAPGPNKTVRLITGDTITSIIGPDRHVVGPPERPEDVRTLAGALTHVRNLAENRRWLRDGGAPSLPPSVWSINVTLGGNYCFVSTDQLRLWKPAADVASELQISDANGQWDVFIELPSGESSRPWPNLPVSSSDGSGTFVFSADAVTDVNVETENIASGTDLDILLSFVNRGCHYQLFLTTEGLPLGNVDE